MTVQARVAFFVILAYLKATEGCDVIQPEIYSSVGEKPSVQIAYTVPASGLSSLQVSKGGISVVSVTYSSGSIITQAIEPIINFTGNLATGDISFHFESVQLENGGKYELLSILDSKTLECVTLTVRGVVTASLSVDKNPAKTKETVVFTCLASSTTSPSVNHTISWSVGAVAVPANSRYSFTETTNISTFTINEVEQVDQGNYVCESTENIPGGGTGKSNGIEFKLEGPTECCCICCFIALIVNVVLNVVLVLVHVILTWQKHEFSVKKIYSGNNKTNEAVCFKDYGIKAALPECCVCVVTIVIQIAVYFAALIQKDCGDSCDKCCEVVICLVVTIIVSIVEAAAGSGIIYIFVNVKGCNYVDQGGNVDSGDSARCGRNNSILPICAGGDQHPLDGNKPSHRPPDDSHQSGEPKSNTTKTDEAGSFVSGKDIKVETGGSSSFRAQPPLPGIKSEKKNTRGLSANIDDYDNNPSYEKMRLTPIGQESHPGWEEKRDRSEDGKEKKKKRKSKDKDKERDSNVTESADL